MLPKNPEIFSELTWLEKLIFRPEEYPWQALLRMFGLLVSCQHGWKRWPRLLPCYTQDGDKMQLHNGVVEVVGSIHVRGGEGLKSDENARIKGPVILGRNVTLRKCAVVTGPCILGDNVVIGHNCRVKNSIIRADSHVYYGTRVSNAVIGRGVRIDPNAVLPDTPVFGCRSNISYLCRTREGRGAHDREIDTMLPELGIMAGDKSVIGAGAVCAPGVILLPETKVAHGCRIRWAGVYRGLQEG